MVNFRWVFVACLALVIGGIWLSDVDESLPTSRLDRDFGSGNEPRRSVKERDLYAEPYTPRQGPKDVIPLPDDGPPLDASLVGSAWKLANSSQMQSRRPKSSQPRKGAGGNGTPADGPVCSPLCGRHGWGECKQGQCVCPVLYNSTDCLTGIELPKTGPLGGLDAKYVGDLTLNRRSVAGQKWVVGFLPEKLHEPDKGQRILGAVTAQLLDALPSRDVLAAGKVYNRCAVVGSSGLLLHYYLGAEISSHDLVLRFNSAPKQGFELHVGNKTTLRLTNSHNWGFFEHYSELVLAPLRSRSALEALVRVRQRFQRMRLAGLSPEFVRYLASSFDFVPSTGLLGVLLALQRCHRVMLYGFQAYEEQGVPYQYYDLCARPSDAERDKKEYTVLKHMAKMGLLAMREPCIETCHDDLPKKCKACQRHHGFTPVSRPKRECPPCSFTPDGCHRNRHWAFRRGRSWPRDHRKKTTSTLEGVGNNGTTKRAMDGKDENAEERDRAKVENQRGDPKLLEEDPFKKAGSDSKGEEAGEGTQDTSVEAEAAEAKAAIVEDKVKEEATPDASEEDNERGEAEGENEKGLRWLKFGGKKGHRSEADSDEDDEASSDGQEKLILEIDKEDEETRTTVKKVWPEFPGKKRGKDEKDVTHTEEIVNEDGDSVEVMSFTRQ